MIDRERLVRRHNVVLADWHPSSTLSVGNGDFAVNVDVTGLQTFPAAHELPPRPVPGADSRGVPWGAAREFRRDDFPVPLRIQSNRGWFRSEPRETFTMEQASTGYRTRRGTVSYADQMPLRATERPRAATWLHRNPRRLDLGRVGLRFPRADVRLDDLGATRIELDLWTGSVHSTFEALGQPVEVWTVVHPDSAVVATRVASPLLSSGDLVVDVAFPRQSEPFEDFEPVLQRTVHLGRGLVERWVGDATYRVAVAAPGADIDAIGDDITVATRAAVVEVSVGFDEPDLLPFDVVAKAAAAHWRRFWTRGAAVSFAGSTDPRAAELERRIVLSQYLTAVHCSGSLPPQESGLLYSTWGGKFHLEMHWWHAAHFALWGRPELLAMSLGWYREILGTGQFQGYAGMRWPKQVGPDGRESPSEIGAFLVWQQPHPIYYAELLRRSDPDADERYRDLVFATAEFMADFAELEDGAFHLGPPVVPAQESYFPDRATTMDPTFELAYWHWGLHVAQQWRERLGLGREPRWDEVLARLARPLIRSGTYAAVATQPYLLRDDHPSMLMALGFLPGTPLIDPAVMGATFDDVLATWDEQSLWGWDFPVLAMCATKLGRPGDAVDALLRDAYKNQYLAAGHVPQLADGLTVYLPANGGLLAAVAMMTVGWEGSHGELPGFPSDGTWRVEHEGLQPFPADVS